MLTSLCQLERYNSEDKFCKQETILFLISRATHLSNSELKIFEGACGIGRGSLGKVETKKQARTIRSICRREYDPLKGHRRNEPGKLGVGNAPLNVTRACPSVMIKSSVPGSPYTQNEARVELGGGTLSGIMLSSIPPCL